MKKAPYPRIELCAVFFLYLLPSIFRKQNTSLPFPAFRILIESLGGISILLLLLRYSGIQRMRWSSYFLTLLTRILQSLPVLVAMILIRILFTQASPMSSFIPGVLAIFAIFSAAFFEELLFRVYIVTRLKAMYAPEWLAVLLSISLFAVAHGYQGTEAMVHAFLQACILTLALRISHSMIPSALAHGTYNILLLVKVIG